MSEEPNTESADGRELNRQDKVLSIDEAAFQAAGPENADEAPDHTKPKLTEVTDQAQEKLAEAKDQAQEKLAEIKEQAQQKADEVKAQAQQKAADVNEQAREKIADAKDQAQQKAGEVKAQAQQKAGEVKAQAQEKIAGVKDQAQQKVAGATETISGTTDDLRHKASQVTPEAAVSGASRAWELVKGNPVPVAVSLAFLAGWLLGRRARSEDDSHDGEGEREGSSASEA